jgi:hypothetical protein
MSTTLLRMTPENGVAVTRFYGGQHRGMCYQVTVENGQYIQLTILQFEAIIKALANSGIDVGWDWRNQ